MKSKRHLLNCLDAELRRTRPATPMPADLHDSIMTAVRMGAKRSAVAAGPARLIWFLVPALIVVIGLGLWWIPTRPSGRAEWLATAPATLEHTGKLPHQATAAMLSPLSRELESLNEDFQKAMNHFLASIP